MSKKWSDLQKQCYERNCNCYGCPVLEEISSTRQCFVKKSLIEQIRKFGLDEEVKTKCAIIEK